MAAAGASRADRQHVADVDLLVAEVKDGAGAVAFDAGHLAGGPRHRHDGGGIGTVGGGGDRDGIGAVGLGAAAFVGAVPSQPVDAGAAVAGQGVDQRTAAVEDVDAHRAYALRHLIGDLGAAAGQRDAVAGGFDAVADIADRAVEAAGRLGRDQLVEPGVGAGLLFDLGEHRQLIGHLGRVHRIGRVLVLQLGREQGQKFLEVIIQRRRRIGARARLGRGRTASRGGLIDQQVGGGGGGVGGKQAAGHGDLHGGAG